MPIQHRGHQTNIFGVADNADIELSVRIPADRPVKPDQQLTLNVQITNHSPTTTYRLILTVHGLPKVVRTIEPRSLTIEPDSEETARLTISPSSVVPEAGKAEVKIVAQPDGENSPGYCWSSRIQEVTICAVPGLELDAKPFGHIGGRAYRATVTVVNSGNTRQTGTVAVSVPPTVSAVVDDADYDLDPGMSAAPAIVDVSLLRQRWWRGSYPIYVGARPSEQKSPVTGMPQPVLTLRLEESGLLADFGERAVSVLRRAKQAGQQTWIRSRTRFPGSWRLVVTATLAVFIFGVLAGAWLPKSDGSPADRAVPAGTAAAPTPNGAAPTRPYPEPVQLTATDLPCGKWIVFLAQSADGDPLGSFLRVAAQARLTGKISRLSYAYGAGRCGTRPTNPWILYAGPYASQEDAIAASASSGVPNSYTIQLKTS